MGEGGPALAAAGLSFRTGGRILLAEAGLTLHRGEVLGILGPNGAGKSTLLRLCAGLLRPATGEVTLLGRKLRDWPGAERARRLGYLPQHFAPHWDYSVAELLRLGLERGGVGAGPRALERVAERFGLAELLPRRWSSLSGGERGRVLSGSVLAPEPPVVLADEPAAALDVGQAAALMQRLRSHAAQGAGVAVVVHDLNLAARFCDRLVLLSGGRVRLADATARVMASPALDATFGIGFERLAGPGGSTVVVGSLAGCGVP